MSIETAENYFTKVDRPEARKRLRDRPFILNREVANRRLKAEINHSRWIVECPHCGNAEFLFADKKFFCSQCKNEMIGGKLYGVILPKKKPQIETLLEPRPIRNRSWKYPETIDDLAKENELHIEEIS